MAAITSQPIGVGMNTSMSRFFFSFMPFLSVRTTSWAVSGVHRSTGLVVRPQLLSGFHLFVFHAQFIAEVSDVFFWDFK